MSSRLQDVILRGLAASRPLATAVAPGTLYFSTDTSITERSNGTAWETYADIPAIASHASSHEPGGSDPLTVDAIPATGSLRTLGTGANQATAGNDSRLTNSRAPTAHALSHSDGAADPVDVTDLAGYPGGTSTFLRANGTFGPASIGSITGGLFDYKFVRKTSDESVTSNATPQDDNELFFAIGANETWLFDFTLFVTGNETGDIRIGPSAPVGATLKWVADAIASGQAATASFGVINRGIAGGTTNSVSASATETAVFMRGMVINGVTPGNLQLIWAQGTSNGTATIVKTNSYLEARRVA